MNKYKIILNPDRTRRPLLHAYTDGTPLKMKIGLDGLTFHMADLSKLPQRLADIFEYGGYNANEIGYSVVTTMGEKIFIDEGMVHIFSGFQNAWISEKQFYEIVLQVVERSLEDGHPELGPEWEKSVRDSIPVLKELIANSHYPEVKSMPLKHSMYIFDFKENDLHQPFTVIGNPFFNIDIEIDPDGAIQIFRDTLIKDIPMFLNKALQGTNYEAGAYGFLFGPYIKDDILLVDEGIVEIYNESDAIGFSYRQFYLLSILLAEKALEAVSGFDLLSKGIIDTDWQSAIEQSLPLLKEKFNFHNRTNID